MNLPPIERLLQSLDAHESDGDSYTAVLGRLQAQRGKLARYESVDELAFQAFDEDIDDPDAEALAELIAYVRAVITREFRSYQYFVAPEVVDSLLFEEFASDTQDPAVAVVQRLVESRIGADGLLVFGLHSLGFVAAGSAGFYGGAQELIEPDWGLALSSQTNRLSNSIQFLDRVRHEFCAAQSLDVDLIEHWHRSRPAAWLVHNPLLVVRVAEASGSYFGTESLLLLRLEAGAALLAAIAALWPSTASLTTATVNNVETFDIHHYMVLSPARSIHEPLGGDFVPISRTARAKRRISSLPITLDLAVVEAEREHVTAVWRAIEKIYAGYLRHSPNSDSEDGRRYRKWFESLRYFRHSLGGTQWDAYVALSVAFECLLTEDAQSDKSKKIRRRLRELVGQPARTKYDESLQHLYRARVELLHSGLRDSTVNLTLARQAYVDALVGHVSASA